MATAKKPTAQQKAQAKARAGGNNPIKVTNAGVKRLGKAALIAGSMLPAGRAVKVASMAVKAGKTAKAASAAQKIAYKEKITIPVKRVLKAAKAEAKAEARGLKAANKPTKASKTSIGNNEKISPAMRAKALKTEKPANPNAVRGGSMKSKVNWPDSMKNTTKK